MDFKTLQYFYTVAREQNITHAARKLHISQPPLSAQIRQLDGTHWRADGYVGLYRHIVTQTPEGFTLVSIYRPTGEISGAPRRYTREGIPVPVAMLT